MIHMYCVIVASGLCRELCSLGGPVVRQQGLKHSQWSRAISGNNSLAICAAFSAR